MKTARAGNTLNAMRDDVSPTEVGGQVAAVWTVRDGVVRVEPLRPLSRAEEDAVEEERAALEAFHA